MFLNLNFYSLASISLECWNHRRSTILHLILVILEIEPRAFCRLGILCQRSHMLAIICLLLFNDSMYLSS